MSSGQAFPTLTGALDHPGMEADASANWYSPSYPFGDPYLDAYPCATTTVEHQSWPLPEINMNSYGGGVQQSGSQPFTPQVNHSRRNRRSPSHLGLTADGLCWSAHGLGIQYTPPPSANIPTPPISSTFSSMSYPASAGIPTPPVSSTFPPMSFTASIGVPTPPVSSTFPPLAFTAAAGVPTPPVSSTFTPNSFQTYPTDDMYKLSSPDLRRAQSGRPYTSIAPNPSPLAEKRKREDDEQAAVSDNSSSKRRKRTSSATSAILNDEDKVLLRLKEEEKLPWKEVIVRFKEETTKSHTVASLQMRYKRLRDKHRVWEDADVEALKRAHDYWESAKWDIISAKMVDFGISEKWPPRHCGRKWQELEEIPPLMIPPPPPPHHPHHHHHHHPHHHPQHSHFNTPTSASQLSSPIDGPPQFNNWVSMSSSS